MWDFEKGHLTYHVSDQDGLHLGGREVSQDVRSKQRRHLKKKEQNNRQP